jgi:hypothetical protein
VSLTLTWPLRLCLLRVLCASRCYKLSPFQAHWGRWRYTQILQPACSRGKWPFPLLPWSFPTTATFTGFPAPGCWTCATAPAFSGQLVFLQFCGGLPLPHFGAQGALPSSLRVCFCCCCLLFSFFFFFFPESGSVCLGGYADLAQGCLWEYRMPLSSPGGLRLPKWSRSWRLAAREPSWFLCLMWSGDAMRGLGVWRNQSFASSHWFFL